MIFGKSGHRKKNLYDWLLTLGLFCFIAYHQNLLAQQQTAQETPKSSLDDVADKSDGQKRQNWFPVIFYTDENSLALGAGIMRGFHWADSTPEQRPNSITALFFYTLKNQSVVNVAPDLYLQNEKYNLHMELSLANMPSKFFGRDNSASTEVSSEDYTLRRGVVSTSIVRKLYSSFRAGPQIVVDRSEIADTDAAGLLESGTIVGSRDGNVIGGGLIFDWDDRDHLFWPTSGGYHQLIGLAFREQFGSDYNFNQMRLDLRQFFGISEKTSLAIQFNYTLSDGNVPFYYLAMLGGPKNMRGIYEGYYRDNNMYSLQTEYRILMQGRWSATVFASLGQVAHQIGDFEITQQKYAAGAGLRFALDPKHKMNLRFDIGFSESGVSPIIILGEAF